MRCPMCRGSRWPSHIWRMGSGIEGTADVHPHWMPCPICNQAALPAWRHAMRAAAFAITATLAACGPDAKLPPLPTPGPDMCLIYRAFNYSPAAAAVEAIETLKKHTANEGDFYQKCVTEHPKLDPARPGGPR